MIQNKDPKKSFYIKNNGKQYTSKLIVTNMEVQLNIIKYFLNKYNITLKINDLGITSHVITTKS